MKRLKKQQGGFTLLELLVVVAIIAIIAGAVISAIDGQEERAGQGVALHTMAALENATRQHVVINDGLPSGLDALVSLAGTDPAADTPQIMCNTEDIAEADADLGITGNTTDDNGLTSRVNLEITTEATAALNAAGITTLVYVENDECSEDEAANEMFREDDAIVHPVPGTLANLPLLILDDPEEVGGQSNDIVAVLGVGNRSSFVTPGEGESKILSRSPIDGNADGDGVAYSQFSLAVRIGNLGVGDDYDDGDAAAASSSVFDADNVEILAVLDSDGDSYNEEVAEFAGLQDEDD